MKKERSEQELVKICEEAFEKVKKKFPVTIKDEDYERDREGTMDKGLEQWREIERYLKDDLNLRAYEKHVLFQVCRPHYNWTGWAPSLTDLAYGCELLSRSKK